MKDSLKNEVNQKKSLQNKMQYEYEKTTALQKAAFEKTQDSLKLVNERKMALQALDFEYTQKQAQAKSEEERQVLLYEEALKRSRIEGDFKQKQTALKAEQLRKEAIAKAEQEKKEVLAKEEKAKQRLILLSVSLGLFLVFVFALFMYNRYKLTQKQKSIIEKQKEEVDNQRLLADSRRVIAEKQKEIIENQKHLVEEKQKEILDSINYAKRIQLTLLANEQFLKDNLNEYFSYFNPKDIVSGDFYWATKIVTSGGVENFYLAVCDSTGHGVPGAFMSLLSIGFLSEAINEKGIEQPNNVLNYVRERLTASISKEGQQDGFDGILVCFSKDKITYAAANNAPVLVRHNEIIELNADRMPVGLGERKESFNLYTLDSQKGDMLYLYTDGYADQFGGPKGKKFRYKPLNELLLSNAQLSSTEQHHQLKTTFNNWKGNIEQVDDVCVCGVRL
jgi:serine phosphatase RsbU (regulator of sigma subunit)